MYILYPRNDEILWSIQKGTCGIVTKLNLEKQVE